MQTDEDWIFPAKQSDAYVSGKEIGVVHVRFFIDAL